MDNEYPTFEEFVKSINEFNFVLNYGNPPEDEYKITRNKIYEYYKMCIELAKAGKIPTLV